MCIVVLPECVSMHHMCALNSQKSEESVRSPGARVTDSCESACGCWEPNQGSLPNRRETFSDQDESGCYWKGLLSTVVLVSNKPKQNCLDCNNCQFLGDVA